MRLRPSRRPVRPPEMIPLINIVFLMLIFFLVAATLRPFAMEGVRPPTGDGDAGIEAGAPRVILTRDGRVLANGRPVAIADLSSALATPAQMSTLTVLVDRDVDGRELVRVAGAAEAAGFRSVRVVTQRGAASDGR